MTSGRASQSITGMPLSTYDGTNGIAYRSDLAGLNLTTVPKVLIECGNMQNTTDASMLTSTAFQQDAASGPGRCHHNVPRLSRPGVPEPR